VNEDKKFSNSWQSKCDAQMQPCICMQQIENPRQPTSTSYSG